MSLELKIEQLTKAVEVLTAAMQAAVAPTIRQHLETVTQAPMQFKMDANSQQAQAMLNQVAAAPTPPMVQPVQTAPAMPAPPTFAPAPQPVQQAGVPFNDGKSLIEYVMGRYKALGPEKGAQIQNVLTGLGYQNINDIKPEHYPQFHAGVEAIQ
jgi:hypothetical protein